MPPALPVATNGPALSRAWAGCLIWDALIIKILSAMLLFTLTAVVNEIDLRRIMNISRQMYRPIGGGLHDIGTFATPT